VIKEFIAVMLGVWTPVAMVAWWMNRSSYNDDIMAKSENFVRQNDLLMKIAQLKDEKKKAEIVAYISNMMMNNNFSLIDSVTARVEELLKGEGGV